MTRVDKLAIAVKAIATLPSLARTSGTFHPASSRMPRYWELHTLGFQIVFTEGVLLAPIDEELSSMLDVWPDGGRKVMSASWHPARPWQPPRIAAFRTGEWIEILGLQTK